PRRSRGEEELERSTGEKLLAPHEESTAMDRQGLEWRFAHCAAESQSSGGRGRLALERIVRHSVVKKIASAIDGVFEERRDEARPSFRTHSFFAIAPFLTDPERQVDQRGEADH